MAFSDNYADIHSPFVENFKSSKNDKGQKAVLKNVANTVSKSRDLHKDIVTELPKDLPNVCPFLFLL